jgi:hypothetical protein
MRALESPSLLRLKSEESYGSTRRIGFETGSKESAMDFNYSD